MSELSKTQLPSHRYRWLKCYIQSHLSQLHLNEAIDWIQESLDKHWIEMAEILTELHLPVHHPSRAINQALNAQSWTLIFYISQQFTQTERISTHLPAIPILSTFLASIMKTSNAGLLTENHANEYMRSLFLIHGMGRTWRDRPRFIAFLSKGHDLLLEYLAEFLKMRDLMAILIPYRLLTMSNDPDTYCEILKVYQEHISDLILSIPEFNRPYLQLYSFIQMHAFYQLPIESQYLILQLPFTPNDSNAGLILLPQLLPITEIPPAFKENFKHIFLKDLYHILKRVEDSISWISSFRAILRTWTITPQEFMPFFHLVKENDDGFTMEFIDLMIELVLWDTQQGTRPMTIQGIQIFQQIPKISPQFNWSLFQSFGESLKEMLGNSPFLNDILRQAQDCLITV
jgi:hypothetical protein